MSRGEPSDLAAPRLTEPAPEITCEVDLDDGDNNDDEPPTRRSPPPLRRPERARPRDSDEPTMFDLQRLARQSFASGARASRPDAPRRSAIELDPSINAAAAAHFYDTLRPVSPASAPAPRAPAPAPRSRYAATLAFARAMGFATLVMAAGLGLGQRFHAVPLLAARSGLQRAAEFQLFAVRSALAAAQRDKDSSAAGQSASPEAPAAAHLAGCAPPPLGVPAGTSAPLPATTSAPLPAPPGARFATAAPYSANPGALAAARPWGTPAMGATPQTRSPTQSQWQTPSRPRPAPPEAGAPEPSEDAPAPAETAQAAPTLDEAMARAVGARLPPAPRSAGTSSAPVTP